MAVGAYSYTNLLAQVADTTLYNNLGSQLTVRNIINRSVRMVNSSIDLRSAKRRAQISPFIFSDIYDYTCPSDLKDRAIIDVLPQVNRSPNQKMFLRTEEYFDRKKSFEHNMVAVADDDLVRKLKINIDVTDTALEISGLDSLSDGGGTWATFSAGSDGVVADGDNYVVGSGSIKYDLVSGTTTAGIANSTLDSIDASDYVTAGSVFVWAYIASTTDLTNFIIRIGSSSSDYYTQTVTTTNEGVAFQAGWNLLRFDFASMTQTGSPVSTAFDYCALIMTKASGKEDNGYRFDNIVIQRGDIYQVIYYSKYPWQTAAAAYIENSTADTDLINGDTDEIDLFVLKAKEQLWMELREFELMKEASKMYETAARSYKMRYKSEKLKNQDRYW